MGKLNSNDLHPKVRTINHRRLFQTFHNKDQSEIENLMRKLLTPSEIEIFSKRIAVAVLLEMGADYREIGDLLKVSKSTIAHVNNLYRYDEDLRDLASDFVKEESKPREKYYSLNQVATDLGIELNQIFSKR